jgi:hypothetical protein
LRATPLADRPFGLIELVAVAYNTTHYSSFQTSISRRMTMVSFSRVGAVRRNHSPSRLEMVVMAGLLLVVLAARSYAATIPSYGLEWPGDGAVRRMLYWHNPFPMYDATYIFKVYPRKKTSGAYRYYTTFFWGNDGSFIWDGGNGNTYYGAHPYPTPPPTGPGQWEISVYSNDYVTGTEVQWDRWYTQAFRAWRESPSITHHEFYWDLPDTSKVISRTVVDPAWASKNPPTPSIHMGQAAWGYYPGDEEFNGIIRGIQIYSGLLSIADIQSEIAAPKSTLAGQNLMWYLNIDPRPSDVTDKKGMGITHNPLWRGTTALEWTDQTSSPDDTTPPTVSISSPTNGSTVSGTVSVSANASDDVGVAGVQFMVDGANLGAEDTTGPYAISWNTTTAINGSHVITAAARDAAGHTTTSNPVTVTVLNNTSAPPPPSTGGLVAAYSFDEGSGTAAQDSSGNGNAGTLTNGLAWTTQGEYGSALSFDGVNDYVTVPNSPSLDISGTNITLSAWVNITDNNNIDYVIIGKPWASSSMPSPYYQYAIEFDANGRKTIDFFFGDPSGTLHGPFSTTAPLGVWTHIAFTYNGSAVKGYVDGIEKLSVPETQSIQARGNSLRIGVDGAFSQAFKGQIDDVRIYNRTLSLVEIQNDMNTAVGGGTPPPPTTDTTPATVSISSPSSGSTISGSVTVVVSATDNVGVTTLEYRLDGSTLARFSPPVGTWLWNTKTATNGSHTLSARAYDAAGNTAQAAVSVTVGNDTTPPSVSITSPSNGARVTSKTTIRVSAKDNVGLSNNVKVYGDGALIGTVQCSNSTNCSGTVQWSTITRGRHTITAVATDTSGNSSTPASITVRR